MEKLFEKLIGLLTEPSQLILLAWVLYLIKENWKCHAVTDRLLKAQEDRGIVLTKITVMLEAMFNDSRRPK